MKEKRTTIPKATKEKILKEWTHSCGMCGNKDLMPELHHIDEDRTNNESLNLIPICPNCHSKQHNVFQAIDKDILKFYRKFKHPYILLPQFIPLYNRLKFLENANSELSVMLVVKANEFLKLVSYHKMGKFYSKQIKKLIAGKPHLRPSKNKLNLRSVQRISQDTIVVQIDKNKEKVFELIIEMLWYQKWN